MIEIDKVYCEDCVKTMSNMERDIIDLIITSPPYFGCRYYGNETVGREEHPLEYCKNLVQITEYMKMILKPTGSLYLNIGDVYFGTKGFSRNKGKFLRKFDTHYNEHKIVKEDGKYLQYKQLLLLPTRIAGMMQDNGWILRNSIIWEKTNPLPAYAPDRRMPCYEYFFHFVKTGSYFFDWKEAKRIESHRDVFRSSVKSFGKHQASFSEDIITPFILTSSKKNDIIYDPFMGSGTIAVAAKRNHRHFVGSEINSEYAILCQKNIEQVISQSNVEF